MKEQQELLKIKNLRVNLPVFLLASTITLTAISGIVAIKNIEEEFATSPKYKVEFPVPLNEIPKIKTEQEIKQVVENIQIEEPKVKSEVELEVKSEVELEVEPEVEEISYEKEYSGMKLSHELEDAIKSLCDEYLIPYQIVLVIGYRESAGNWNNNGVVSKTGDYGMFQINECNLEFIEKELGYTKEEILNDDVKNAHASIYWLKHNILDRSDVTELEEIFGMYNGWVGWRKKSISKAYVKGCLEVMEEYFPNFRYYINKDKAFH